MKNAILNVFQNKLNPPKNLTPTGRPINLKRSLDYMMTSDDACEKDKSDAQLARQEAKQAKNAKIEENKAKRDAAKQI